MKCKICGSRINDGISKCTVCGSLISADIEDSNFKKEINLSKKNCPKCNNLVIGEHRYCPTCNWKLDDPYKEKDNVSFVSISDTNSENRNDYDTKGFESDKLRKAVDEEGKQAEERKKMTADQDDGSLFLSLFRKFWDKDVSKEEATRVTLIGLIVIAVILLIHVFFVRDIVMIAFYKLKYLDSVDKSFGGAGIVVHGICWGIALLVDVSFIKALKVTKK